MKRNNNALENQKEIKKPSEKVGHEQTDDVIVAVEAETGQSRDKSSDEDKQMFISYRSSDAFRGRNSRRLNSDSFV